MTDLGYSVASFLVRALPARVTDSLADLASDAYVLSHPRRASAVRRTLARIWEDARHEGPPPRPRETYRAFARALRDFLAYEPGRAGARVRLTERARASLEEARRSRRGVVLVSGHFGPWERALQWLAEERGGMEALAARHRSQAIERFFVARRARGGVRTLCSSRPVVSALRSLTAGGWIAALADRPRRPPAPPCGIVPLDPGPLLLARRSGALVLPGVSAFAPDGALDVDFLPPFGIDSRDRSLTMVEARVRLQRFFDAHVRAHPTQWFAWGFAPRP